MSRISEYGALPADAQWVQVTEIKTGTKTCYGGKIKTLHLVHKTAGWTTAGSMARYDEETYAVLEYDSGVTYGANVRTLEAAEELLAKWANPVQEAVAA